jgi:hypothetical protein
LFFSTFNFAGTVNGGVPADFEVAHHVGSFSSSVPDAGQSLVLMMLGLGGLAGIGILRRERSISKAVWAIYEGRSVPH